jgi:hypothetical protein
MDTSFGVCVERGGGGGALQAVHCVVQAHPLLLTWPTRRRPSLPWAARWQRTTTHGPRRPNACCPLPTSCSPATRTRCSLWCCCVCLGRACPGVCCTSLAPCSPLTCRGTASGLCSRWGGGAVRFVFAGALVVGCRRQHSVRKGGSVPAMHPPYMYATSLHATSLHVFTLPVPVPGTPLPPIYAAWSLRVSHARCLDSREVVGGGVGACSVLVVHVCKCACVCISSAPAFVYTHASICPCTCARARLCVWSCWAGTWSERA